MGDIDNRHRLVVLGSGRVGKTSIITRFLKDNFTANYKETVEDLYCREYDVNGTQVKVDILDTAGNLAFPAMRRLSISTAHAFLLVYALDDPHSLEEVQRIWEQIKEQRTNYQEIPLVVAANKSDLDNDEKQIKEEIMTEWIETQAIQSKHIEVSAKENEGILDIFQKLLNQAKIPEARHLDTMLSRRRSLIDRRRRHSDVLEISEETDISDVGVEKEKLVRKRSTPVKATNLQLEQLEKKQKPRRKSLFSLILSDNNYCQDVNEEDRLENETDDNLNDKLFRSRSLVRRGSKPKVKRSKDPTKNDCVIS